MNTLRVVPMALVLALLGGCAMTKPVLTESGYEDYAKVYSAIHNCNESGKLSPELAAQGLKHIQSNLNSYAYYPEQLAGNLEYFKQYEEVPTEAICNKLALQIERNKQRINTQNYNAQVNQNDLNTVVNNRPKHTICDRIGWQTLCTTY